MGIGDFGVRKKDQMFKFCVFDQHEGKQFKETKLHMTTVSILTPSMF